MSHLIGITGLAGSGKDTVANHLVEVHGFVKMAFVTPLKETLARLFDLSRDQLYDIKQKEEVDERYGVTPRWLMQYIGTDVCRNLYSSIWVDLLLREYKRIHAPVHQSVVVSDVRFVNEAVAIRAAGGKVWRVVCPDNPRMKAGAFGGNWEHPSEKEQADIEADETLSAQFGEIPALLASVDVLLGTGNRDKTDG